MDRIWTPWRFNYVSQPSSSLSPREEEGCILCLLSQSTDDQDNFLLFRGETCYVILNLFPYTTGHLMIVPYRHIPLLEDLDSRESSEIMCLAQRSQTILSRIYRPDGFNLGMNMGSCAGAGIAGHLHLHLLPRWSGDTNFMTVIGENRVLPETLSSTYKKILPLFIE